MELVLTVPDTVNGIDRLMVLTSAFVVESRAHMPMR